MRLWHGKATQQVALRTRSPKALWYIYVQDEEDTNRSLGWEKLRLYLKKRSRSILEDVIGYGWTDLWFVSFCMGFTYVKKDEEICLSRCSWRYIDLLFYHVLLNNLRLQNVVGELDADSVIWTCFLRAVVSTVEMTQSCCINVLHIKSDTSKLLLTLPCVAKLHISLSERKT